MMTFCIVLERLTSRTFEKTIKEFIFHKKGIDYDILGIERAELAFMHEAYSKNPFQNVNHTFFKEYFDEHLSKVYANIKTDIVYPSNELQTIETNLKSKEALLSTAIHQERTSGGHGTHIVTIGYDTEYYLVDTRPNTPPYYLLGNSMNGLKSILYPTFVKDPKPGSQIFFGDCLYIEKT